MMVDITVNKRELAKKLTISLPTLDRLIDRYGDEFPIEHHGSNGREYEFSVIKVREFLDECRAQQARQVEETMGFLKDLELTLPGREETTGLSLPQVLVHENILAKRHKRLQEEGLLVDVASLSAELISVFQGVGRHLDGIPDRLSRRFNLPDGVVESIRSELHDERTRLHAKMTALLKTEKGIDEAEDETLVRTALG